MKLFRKHCLCCIGWLFISELLCLVLAFSFAILRPQWIRWLSLICGAAAHIALMGNCAQKVAAEDAAVFRQTQLRIPPYKPLLLAFLTALPLWILYGILWLHADSTAMLNVFLLLNAPFIQIHRLLLDGAEPFSAVPPLRQICMGLLPLITAAAWYIGYLTARRKSRI